MADNNTITKDNGQAKKGLSVKTLVLLCSSGFVVVAVIVAICIMLSPFGQYNLGISALNKGKYESAVKHLTSAGAYRDAQFHLVEANNALNYQLAQQAFSAGDYATAIEKCTLIPGYLDADDLLVLSETNYHYQQGVALYASGDYLNAVEEFVQVPDFQDSQERIFNCGMGLLEEGDYENASIVFSETDHEGAEGYEDYASGMKNYVNGNYTAAVLYFGYASGVEDSDELLVECAYVCGMNEMDYRDYDDARDYFILSAGYEDSDLMKTNCDLMLAEEEFRTGNLYTAQTAFQALPSELEYNGVSVSERLSLLEQYSDYVNICGEWDVTSGTMTTRRSTSYSVDGWEYEFDPSRDNDTLDLRCVINDDGSVTINGNASYKVFTNYSSVREWLTTSNRSFNFSVTVTALSGTYEIREGITLTIFDGSFEIVDVKTDTPYSWTTETYTTDIVFGEMNRWHRN